MNKGSHRNYLKHKRHNNSKVWVKEVKNERENLNKEVDKYVINFKKWSKNILDKVTNSST